MTANELHQKYLEFFKSKGHAVIPSASLIPENDPTVLFTTAGMHPLVPFLMGEKHPAGSRLVNFQKCVRTGDIDEVGDGSHHTFFEMLGNWSLGDYFKKEAIEWSWEFLTSPQWLGLDKNRLAVSVFKGDDDAPFDQEAHDIWLRLGVPEERIARLPKKNNWWGPAGEKGPCGPDTEMFYWTGDPAKVPAGFNDDNVAWLEIWNDVFMQYNKTADGKFEPLQQKNVDTGMGLERILSVMNGYDDNYRTELFWPIILKLEELSGKKYDDSPETKRTMRVIADHLKAATFIMGDERGVTPSNLGAGYVVRRLIRRAVRYGKQLGIKDIFTSRIGQEVVKIYSEIFPELKKNESFVENEFLKEEKKFSELIQDGLKIADKIIKQKTSIPAAIYNKIMALPVNEKNEAFKKIYLEPSVQNDFMDKHGIAVTNENIFAATITGKESFNLFQTYGFPIEMIIELAQEKKLFVDKESFEAELKKHQDLSRTASAGMFKGGLADASEATVKYHTAAHLLLAALRKVLGESVVQKGSNITAERLRFDFSYAEKMTDEQKKKVEELVNNAIKADLPVTCDEMTLEEAKTAGAHGTFENKYGDRVKVYTMGAGEQAFSKEICGGPHVNNTGVLGRFKIQKEESSSAGVRRIKAILE